MCSPQVFLVSAMLVLVLLIPTLHCNRTLLCYYSPIMYRNTTPHPTLSECPPTELCMNGVGRYGNHSALSSRGCVERSACGRAHNVLMKGTNYIMVYLCCDYNYCNTGCRVTGKSFPFVVAITCLLFTGR
ncbi:hypothetical protein DPEC_G00160570 [Dallia pectoralis]|uniref:Uncharacterized protein n=1 Tax=Dallia pectoralis TaxID=75939 RepID=A0ACC2GG04_DALPE|nr:hypothetical protein DPEC_G00160570 [Dallia pectoralis]